MSKSVPTILVYALLTVGGCVLVAPVVWMVVASFMPASQINGYLPSFVPRALTIANFAALSAKLPIIQNITNSLIVTVCVTVGVVITSVSAGYVFATIDFPGKEIAYGAILVLLLVLAQVIIVPVFFVVKDLGWLNSYRGLIVPFLVSPFGMLLIRSYMQSIPIDYFDAAGIFGLSE